LGVEPLIGLLKHEDLPLSTESLCRPVELTEEDRWGNQP
jgi:hypothetical protein